MRKQKKVAVMLMRSLQRCSLATKAARKRRRHPFSRRAKQVTFGVALSVGFGTLAGVGLYTWCRDVSPQWFRSDEAESMRNMRTWLELDNGRVYEYRDFGSAKESSLCTVLCLAQQWPVLVDLLGGEEMLDRSLKRADMRLIMLGRHGYGYSRAQLDYFETREKKDDNDDDELTRLSNFDDGALLVDMSGETLSVFASDVDRVLDALDVPQCSVMAYGDESLFALALAADEHSRERIDHVVLAGSPSENLLDGDGEPLSLLARVRVEWLLRKHRQWLFDKSDDAPAMARWIADNESDEDEVELLQQATRTYGASMRHDFASGVRGVLFDYAMLHGNERDVDFACVKVPVDIWCNDQDVVVSQLVEQIAAEPASLALQHATAMRRPTSIAFGHFPSMMNAVRERRRFSFLKPHPYRSSSSSSSLSSSND
jgi:pimeloyl-ACP methyl ester carboxylesterase